jgi:hypothetical protein
MSHWQKKNLFLLIYCVLVSAVFLALCSKSSFLYPLNDWGDANCFLSVGKSILHGKVLYRDIYDQKGPLLYLIHSIAWLISPTSFTGVYCIEVVFFSWFLMAGAKAARLFLPEAAVYVLLPLLAALILSSPAFCHGDSAEELCLPLVMSPLAVLVHYFKSEYPKPMPYDRILLSGVLAGCILCIKFNLLGFHLVWIVTVVVTCVVRKNLGRALKSFLAFAAGVSVAVLPWITYFLLNHALDSFYDAYIFNNVFLYSKIPDLGWLDRILGRILLILASSLENLQFSVPVVLGLAAVIFTRDFGAAGSGRLSLLLGFFVLLAGVFAGDVFYQYYPLILSVYSVIGLCFIFRTILIRLPKLRLKRPAAALIILTTVAASFAFARAVSPNVYLLGRSRDSMAQYQFRDIIMEADNPTLLTYDFLDFGEYTVCNIEPTCKYFCGLNIRLPEIRETQEDFIKNKKVDYVITRNETPSFILENYTVVLRREQYFEGRSDTYYLLKKLQ